MSEDLFSLFLIRSPFVFLQFLTGWKPIPRWRRIGEHKSSQICTHQEGHLAEWIVIRRTSNPLIGTLD